jgi:WD40 repeat protein
LNAFGARLSADELVAYFQTSVAGSIKIVAASRTTLATPFGAFAPVPNVNSPDATEGNPMPSLDGRRLFFTSNRTGNYDVFEATRGQIDDPFTNVVRREELSSSRNDSEPYFCDATGEVFFTSDRIQEGQADIYRATTLGATFGAPEPVLEVNSPFAEVMPVMMSDGLTLYFGSSRPAGGASGVWMARRGSVAKPFEEPVRVAELGAGIVPSWVSKDGCRLYLSLENDPSKLLVASKPDL